MIEKFRKRTSGPEATPSGGDGEQENQGQVGRRNVLKWMVGIGAGAAIGGVGAKMEYDRRHKERLQNLGRIVAFLSGEADAETTVTFAGQAYR